MKTASKAARVGGWSPIKSGIRSRLRVAAVVIRVLVAGFVLYGAAAHAGGESLEKKLGAVPLPKGWKCSGVTPYDSKNLYELVDGEAELYFPYGFKQLVAANYGSTINRADTLTAEVYELGSLLNAFGVYSNFRDKDSKRVELGGDGFINGTQVVFYQGNYFVKVQAGGKPPENALMDCAKSVSKLLPPNTAKPAELDMLKIDRLIPNTEQYIGQSLLGYDFFRCGLCADANVNGKAERLFIVLEQSPESAEKTLAGYAEFLKKSHANVEWKETSIGKVLTGQDPLHKQVSATVAGPHIVGVAKGTDADLDMTGVMELRARALGLSK